jgi:hopanoid biosynthesis associated protein HpnK
VTGRRVIVTADDFGLGLPVNEAIEHGHRDGIIGSASLMVTAADAEDAVARARRLPGLAVGLHLVLADGRPALAPDEIPALVGRDGRFHENLAVASFAMVRSRAARAQLEREIRAQLELYRRTGLALDHVDAHHHLQMHPLVRASLIRLAPEYGITAIRVPREPTLAGWRATRDKPLLRLASGLTYWRMWRRMTRQFAAAGIACNDWLVGFNDAGTLAADRLGAFLARLPEGTTELCLHVATRHWDAPDAWQRSFGCVGEYRAALDPAIRDMLARSGIARVAFRDLAREAGSAA